MSRLPSRRRFLTTAGATVLLGAAGCVRRTQEAATGVDYPETPAPDYRRWLPAPDALPDGDAGYDAQHLRMDDLTTNEDITGAAAGLRNLFERTGRDPFGVEAEQIDSVVSIDLARATVLSGSFDAAAVDAAASRAGYRRTGSYDEFEIYELPGRRRAAAVSETAIVQARHESAPAVARRIVDASRGAVDRYHEVDPEFERLTDTAAGTASWVHFGGAISAPSGAVRAASDQAYVGDRAFFALVYLFEDAGAATEAKVRSTAAERGNLPRTVPFDVTVDGRVGRAEYARDVEEVLDEDHPLQPIVIWNYEYDAAAAALAVTHRAGDEVQAERLTFRTDEGPTDQQFAASHETVTPGDSVVVSLDPGTDLRVVWKAGDSAVTIGVYRAEGT